MSDCLFCKIVQREIPSSIVYETDQVLVFKDIKPVAPVHLLLIPKAHIDNINDPQLLNAGILNALVAAIQELTNNQKVAPQGFRVVVNSGPDAGEAVPHLHLHLIGGRALSWPPG